MNIVWLQVSCPDSYRGKFTDQHFTETEIGEKYADEVRDVIRKVQSQGKQLSFYIAESMQSCGGQIIYPEGYLQKVFKYVDKLKLNIKKSNESVIFMPPSWKVRQGHLVIGSFVCPFVCP